jgi:galactitol-specific phosphotransferase system IIC component
MKKLFKRALKPISNRKGDGIGTIVIAIIIIVLALIALLTFYPTLRDNANVSADTVKDKMGAFSNELKDLPTTRK